MDRYKGIGSILLAMLVFTTVNAILKTSEHQYPPTQIVFFRSLFSLPIYFLLVFTQKEWGALRVSNYGIHFGRALIGVISLSCLFKSILLLPLADAMTISFASSLFVSLLSIPMLGEQLGSALIGAVLVGFAGVIIVAKPTGDVFNIGALCGVISAFMEAFLMVHSRKLAQVNTSTAIVVYFGLFSTLITGLTLPFVWETPTSHDWIVFLVLGLGGGLGQYFLTVAYRHAPASLLAPMIYSALLWSIFYGVILFGEIPSKTLYIGGGLIIAAGCVVIFRENYAKIKQTD